MTEVLTPSELQLALLDYVTNAAEPTWLMLKEIPETSGDRSVAERALRELEEHGLLRSTREQSGDPLHPAEFDNWWALTDAGWSLLGLVKPARYR